MTRMLLAAGSFAFLSVLAGCWKADIELPENYGLGPPPPPANVAPGNPNDKADLLRENQQLRDRIAYLEYRNGRLSHKYRDAGEDMDKVRADIQHIEAERDRYKAAAGR